MTKGIVRTNNHDSVIADQEIQLRRGYVLFCPEDETTAVEEYDDGTGVGGMDGVRVIVDKEGESGGVGASFVDVCFGCVEGGHEF